MAKRPKTIVKDINKIFPAAIAEYPIAFLRVGSTMARVTSECHYKSIAKMKGEPDIECSTAAVEYYCEARGGYPWIHPELEAYAEKHDGYWEWENAGCIVFIEC